MGFVSNGHTLKALRSPSGVQLYVFCTKCGRYASGKGVKLNQLCVPEKSGQLSRLKKLLEGKHPEKGHWLGEVTMLSVARAWEGPRPEPPPSKESPKPADVETSDPLQELRKLEEALELFQADGNWEEAGETGFAFDDEDWEPLSSGSE